MLRHWWGAAGQPCEGRRDPGCPGTDTAGSIQPRLTPHRAQLSPAAMVGAPQGKPVSERAENSTERGEGNKKCEKQQRKHKVRGGGGGKVGASCHLRGGADYQHCSPWRAPCQSR